MASNYESPLLLRQFQNEPRSVRTLFLDPKQAARVRDHLKNIPYEIAIIEALDIYLQQRTKNYPKALQRQVLKNLNRITLSFNPKITVSGAYIKDRMPFFSLRRRPPSGFLISTHPSLKDTSFFLTVLIHKVEHLIQRWELDHGLSDLTSLNGTWNQYYMEFGAIKAEWEFLSLLPTKIILNDIFQINKLPDETVHKEESLKLLSSFLGNNSFSNFRSKHLYNSYESTTQFYDDFWSRGP